VNCLRPLRCLDYRPALFNLICLIIDRIQSMSKLARKDKNASQEKLGKKRKQAQPGESPKEWFKKAVKKSR
jgi:hypothetical protein